MHLKVFVKLKKPYKPSRLGKKTQKTPKKPKKPKKTQKNQKNPLGWVFLKKPGFFPTLCEPDMRISMFNCDVSQNSTTSEPSVLYCPKNTDYRCKQQKLHKKTWLGFRYGTLDPTNPTHKRSAVAGI